MSAADLHDDVEDQILNIADELQERVLDLVLGTQEKVLDLLEQVVEATGAATSEPAVRFADFLPLSSKVIDRGFEAAEQWLHAEREFMADAVTRFATCASADPPPAAPAV